MKKARRPGSSRWKAFLRFLPALLIIGAVGGLLAVEAFSAEPRASIRIPVSAPASPPVSSPGTAPANAARPGPAPLRILSWNLRDCAATDPKTGERLSFHQPIAQALAELKPDVALFQEIQEDDERGGDIALLSAALAKAGWAMPYVSTVETGGQDDLAVFSRLPLKADGPILEPDAEDPWPRPGQKAELELNSAKITLINFHLKAMSDMESEGTRKAQASGLAALLSRGDWGDARSAYILICGDLNTTNAGDRASSDSTLGILALKSDPDPSNDFSDPVEELKPQVPTFVDSRYRSVLDHILLSPAAAKALVPGSLRIVENLSRVGAVPLSDHRPILIDLSLRLGDSAP